VAASAELEGIVQYGELIDFLQHVGKDPSRLIFEDELTGIHNRRFLLSYLEHKVLWDTREEFPLSLLVIDLDRFKQINDTHGHEAGDQVLTWLATLLRETAGNEGLPVRYGGDEFMLLLPRTDSAGARQVAEGLLNQTAERPFRLRDSGTRLPITLSIGIATAPQDANNATRLLQTADTALYHAKRSGRNQVAAADDVDLEKVFSKAALYRLRSTGIFGRDKELSVVSQALEALTLGKSQFLVFEGSPGSGKTALLETVALNLSENDLFHVIKAAGAQQEAFRPYYLITSILIDLLNQGEEKSSAILEALQPEEIGYLSYVLPHLDKEAAVEDQDPATRREGIFKTLINVLTLALEYRPLVLLIDDLHFADEATLLLLGALIQRDDPRVLLCGTSTESVRLGGEQEAVPFDRFCSARQRELAIRRIQLGPLSANDIAAYLRGVFPGLDMPKGFEHEIVELTQGNPLFTSEIVRKLVRDQKVVLVGREWTIEKLDDGYLPRSLEESVMAEIHALDEAERQLLERASTFGEDVSMSVLTAAADEDETRVFEFLDRAEALGLVQSRFELNDETMRFLGKRVLDISYGAIDENRRRALHEEVGSYQERLYQKGYVPSASLLAYHFKRSANQEKAHRYEQLHAQYTCSVFDPEEAASYTGDTVEVEVEERLDIESVQKHIPSFLRALVTAARSIQLYPADSAAVVRSRVHLGEVLDRIFERNQRLNIAIAEEGLAANGQVLDLSGSRGPAASLRELMQRAQLQGLVFEEGVDDEELLTLLDTLGHLKPESIDRRYWKRFASQHNLRNIDPRQIRYSAVRQAGGAPASREELEPEDLAEIPNILRGFNRASKNIKLYPLDTKPVRDAISEFAGSLHDILQHHQALVLSAVEGSLLANGVRLNTTEYESLAETFIEFMASAGLHSVTFLANVTEDELGTFIDALRDLPDTVDDDFWSAFTKSAGLRGLFLNEHQYALKLVQSILLDEMPEGARIPLPPRPDPGADEGIGMQGPRMGIPGAHGNRGGGGGGEGIERAWSTGEMLVAAAASMTDRQGGRREIPPGAVAELASEGKGADLREAVPRFGKELLVAGEDEVFLQLFHKLFVDFGLETAPTREQIVKACGRLLQDLTLALQRKYGELTAETLTAALAKEDEPLVLHELASILHVMAGTAVQFSDYKSASRIFLALNARRKEIEASGDHNAGSLARILDRTLDPTVQQLLENDLKSGDPERQELAARVLGGVGRPGMSMLIEVIKQEKDFRVRQMAASLLAEMGPEAANQIKTALNLEVTVEQRFHILEVIDIVTQDLRDEVAYCVGDSNPKIRRAAFRLAERLHDEGLIEILAPFAASNDPGIVKGTIRSLAHLRSPRAATVLSEILGTLRDPELVVACCQALGQIGDPVGINALGTVLAEKRFALFGYRWNDQVRATAALALRQIDDPAAAAVLQPFAEDRDARIRQLSRSASVPGGGNNVARPA
jgi:diguanylate cyclase (GGDEF)-like protein